VVSAVGHATLSAVETFGSVCMRAFALIAAVVRRTVDSRELARQTMRLLVDAIPLALVASLVVGGVVAMQGLGYLKRYNATLVYGWAAGVSAFRDVGPMLLGFCLSARTGSKNAAELASMAARERLDAVRALGLDVERTVILPRLGATVLVALLLYLPMCAIVLGTAFVVAFSLGGQNVMVSVWAFVDYVKPTVILEGALRMLAFGAAIGLASCHAGSAVQLRADASARSIGEAVFASSVLSVSGVVVINLILSVLGGAS
jgi:phospholipid/cholesterol/gamma-HCH transport system permease protein